MKEIKFPCELKVDFEEVEGEVVITPSAHYGIESEGVSMRRGISLKLLDEDEHPEEKLSAEEEVLIKNFAKNVVLPKIKEHEGIA